MTIQLKPVDKQVIVITGASSGIGLATAEAAAAKGAKLVLAARSDQTLKDICSQIQGKGGEAMSFTADVSDRKQLGALAEAAIQRYGRIDTWVNNAGLAIYGRLDEVTEEDSRRLFDINFWAVVNGSLIALPYLKKSGGALINVGSEVSEAVAPLLGMYSASKHAVKGFTDALRIEIQEIDKTPVAITLIQPTAVDTPFPQHAKNYMDKEPSLPTPQIDPEQVAEAILKAAAHESRDVKVGVMATVNTTVANLVPTLGDKLSAKQVDHLKSDEPPRAPEGTLYKAGETGHKHGRKGAQQSA